MNHSQILLPMICLVLITGGMGVALIAARYKAVKEGSLSIAYFKYNRGGRPPQYLIKISHHFQNLLETPPLFYLSTIVILLLEKSDPIYLGLAWCYLASRMIHSWIHLGSNNVLHRKNAFIVSYLLIFIIWIRLLLQLMVG
ncbi:MAG: MAPEG family protein [Candidatus Thiodiazotropha lotti]|nr:MAPEG family protein [Candidatus Thiodiazotropha lotti]MCW4221530.1 MAPEG family protein [Candidatus Thiodiazotropha lotti]